MIVCLGWGSLIWCPKELPVKGAWHSDGPMLPVEFARASMDKRITLVICDGSPSVKTLWAELDVPSLDAAKKALASREEISTKNIEKSIGWWSPTESTTRPFADVIGKWATVQKMQGVVWTALKPKIGGYYRMPTKVEVVQHLKELNGAEQDRAREYVQRAPCQIVTPYRAAIEHALGWVASEHS